jgi:lipoprotein-releasing system permease protein
MPWYLHIALKQLFPSGRRWPSFFFLLAVLGVSLGVAVLIIVQSVMGGFGRIYHDKIVATSGSMVVESNGVIYHAGSLTEQLLKHSEVTAVSPYAQGVVMLQHVREDGMILPTFPVLRGVDPKTIGTVLPLDSFRIAGDFSKLNDETVLMSRSLAVELGVWIGDSVEIYTPRMLERMKADEILLPVELSIAGIFDTGWDQFDRSTLLCSLNRMQDLYGLDAGVHGLTVRLKDGIDEQRFARQFDGELQGWDRARSWMDLYADFLWVLALEKNMMFFLLLFIVLVSAFAIAIAQTLTVLRKTREVGLLCALGGQPRQIAAAYCFQGLIIGVIGVVSGILLAVSILYFRDPIIDWISGLTGTRETLVKFYQFAHLPVHYSAFDFILVSISTLLLTVCAGMIPALRAARMKPVDALRSE